MTYKLIRSNRKSIAIEVRAEGILVRAPLQATQAAITAFVNNKADWIKKAQAKIAAAPTPPLGVCFGRITIRNQRSRWGSCSSKGNLNFNCLLMLTPPEVIDSVVVHELCHRKEMNHSKAFYAEVLRVFPDYWKWDKWLKENGPQLMRRMLT